MSGRTARLGFALDACGHKAGPGNVYVLDTRVRSPLYAERIAGPFASEHAAEHWIANLSGYYLLRPDLYGADLAFLMEAARQEDEARTPRCKPLRHVAACTCVGVNRFVCGRCGQDGAAGAAGLCRECSESGVVCPHCGEEMEDDHYQCEAAAGNGYECSTCERWIETPMDHHYNCPDAPVREGVCPLCGQGSPERPVTPEHVCR